MSENRGRQTARQTFSETAGEIFEAAAAAFLMILLFSLYRAARAIPLDRLSAGIVEGYPKFIVFFIVLTIFFYAVFILWLRRRAWLDAILALAAITSLSGLAAFSVGTDYAGPARLIAWIGAAYLCYFLCVVRGYGTDGDLNKKSAAALTALFAAVSFALTAATGIVRHRIFLTSDFDLGIFDQMFYFMGRGEAPVTTSVGYAMNHMLEIHFSPILYLLVPFDKLRPDAETLILLQSLFVSLAAIPLYRIVRLHELERKIAVLLTLGFLLQPGIFGGQLKDFHEIKLLPFFFLSFVYFFERDERDKRFFSAPTAAFFILTLLVKEDAAIYLIAYLLSALFRSESARKRALLYSAAAAIYFIAVTTFILGAESDFSYRYRGLIPEGVERSISALGKVLFTSPFAILIRTFTPEKLTLYALMFAPLVFLPLSGIRKLKNLSLMMPFIAFNLLQDLEWQAIDSQYFMGPVSCFMVIVVAEIESIRRPAKRIFLTALIALTAFLLCLSAHLPKSDYFKKYARESAVYQTLESELKAVPSERSASGASHFYAHLSRRAEIYPTAFEYETDIIAVDLRDSKVPGLFKRVLTLIQDQGYGVRSYRRDYWVILEKELESDATQVVIGEMSYLTR